MKCHPQGSRWQKMKPMVLSLTDHSSYQLLHMIDPKLHLLNSFLAFLRCVSMFALYTFLVASHNCFHSCNPWPNACTSFNLDAGYKILMSACCQRDSCMGQNVFATNSSCGYYLLRLQITLPTYIAV